MGGLKPDDCVLDVGSGIGRVAVPLTTYLSPEGEYWGFDIVRAGIAWCKSHITPRYGNFHFLHCDIYNKFYSPNGRISAREFQFPFADRYFDFVFLTSVFTHMLPLDISNYLLQISRVLKPNRTCFITAFLLNQEALQLIRMGSSSLDFKYEVDGCLTIDKQRPEDALAYREEIMLDMIEKSGLRVKKPVFYGSWCGRTAPQAYEGSAVGTYQDIIVASRVQ